MFLVSALYLYWCLNGQPDLTAQTAGFSDYVWLECPRRIYRTTGDAQRRKNMKKNTQTGISNCKKEMVSPMTRYRADVICTSMFSIFNTPAITRSHKYLHHQIDSQELTDVLLFQLLYERHYLCSYKTAAICEVVWMILKKCYVFAIHLTFPPCIVGFFAPLQVDWIVLTLLSLVLWWW